MAPTSKQLSNHEIIVMAVYLLGGDSGFVDTEDIAVKANEIAPGRFTWRKYKEQINIQMIRVALSNAKKLENGSLVLGSDNQGWMLTESGRKLAERKSDSLGAQDLGRNRQSPKERLWLQNERVRLLSSDAYQKY